VLRIKNSRTREDYKSIYVLQEYRRLQWHGAMGREEIRGGVPLCPPPKQINPDNCTYIIIIIIIIIIIMYLMKKYCVHSKFKINYYRIGAPEHSQDERHTASRKLQRELSETHLTLQPHIYNTLLRLHNYTVNSKS